MRNRQTPRQRNATLYCRWYTLAGGWQSWETHFELGPRSRVSFDESRLSFGEPKARRLRANT